MLDNGQEDDWFGATWIRWAVLIIVVGLAGIGAICTMPVIAILTGKLSTGTLNNE